MTCGRAYCDAVAGPQHSSHRVDMLCVDVLTRTGSNETLVGPGHNCTTCAIGYEDWIRLVVDGFCKWYTTHRPDSVSGCIKPLRVNIPVRVAGSRIVPRHNHAAVTVGDG